MENSSRFSILVIEDDADSLGNLRDLLELEDYVVTTAATAAEALARTDWADFSAIILDRLLPDARAEELLPELKRLAPQADVIIVTGYSDTEGVVAALRNGAADYIVKPLNAGVLRASLQRIVERRRLQMAKERSENTFRHLVEAAEAMIVIVRPDLSIAYFSPFAERLTGYSAHEVHGCNFAQLFFREHFRQAITEEFSHILSGATTRGFENPVVCRDGSTRWMIWNKQLVPDYDGGPAVLAVGQDMTNVKQAQQRALRSERLAAIGEMVAGLAHESRNALQRSQACLEMLALSVHDRPDDLDLIARIQKAQDQLHLLYEDVRSYAAPIKLERRLCNLQEVWQEAWGNLLPEREAKAARLREELDGHDLRVWVDPFRLGQVFRNIFDNALAVTPHPAEIEVRAAAAEIDGQPALRVAVRDNGPGIEPELRQKVFEPFFTTKAKGTGLGMAIARRIVEAHGGRIEAGDPGAGAEFVITLPREVS
jgi:two-component system, LuxR family, sensor kinase FixL